VHLQLEFTCLLPVLVLSLSKEESMAIIDLFSKRQKCIRGEVPDVFTYDEIPDPLRVQFVHIWRSCLGDDKEYRNEYLGVSGAYKFIVKTLCREYGIFKLCDGSYGPRDYMQELFDFVLHEKNIEKVLDAIELSFRYLDRICRHFEYRRLSDPSKNIDDAISELNFRFKEHGVGFQFEEDEIIRVDSQLLHAEAVKPALTLLNKKEYAGAQQEFLNAYDHFRHGNQKEALNDALKSFESTIKAICDKKGWTYDTKDTSKKLIEICYKKEIIPEFWQQHMAALRSLLEGGVPTGRNKLSGHGQGRTPTTVPDHIVSYVLHMTAAAIVFLVKSADQIK
jgi:hypothetical protein